MGNGVSQYKLDLADCGTHKSMLRYGKALTECLRGSVNREAQIIVHNTSSLTHNYQFTGPAGSSLEGTSFLLKTTLFSRFRDEKKHVFKFPKYDGTNFGIKPSHKPKVLSCSSLQGLGLIRK